MISNLTDEHTIEEEEPPAPATWGKEEESSPKNESVPISDINGDVEKDVSPSPEPALTDTSEISIKGGTEVPVNDVSSSKSTSDRKSEVPPPVSTTKASER